MSPILGKNSNRQNRGWLEDRRVHGREEGDAAYQREGRHGHSQGDTGKEQTAIDPPPHRTDTNRAERRVKKDPLIETPEGEGEEGYLLRYTPNQEDLQIKEAYG